MSFGANAILEALDRMLSRASERSDDDELENIADDLRSFADRLPGMLVSVDGGEPVQPRTAIVWSHGYELRIGGRPVDIDGGTVRRDGNRLVFTDGRGAEITLALRHRDPQARRDQRRLAAHMATLPRRTGQVHLGGKQVEIDGVKRTRFTFEMPEGGYVNAYLPAHIAHADRPIAPFSADFVDIGGINVMI